MEGSESVSNQKNMVTWYFGYVGIICVGTHMVCNINYPLVQAKPFGFQLGVYAHTSQPIIIFC